MTSEKSSNYDAFKDGSLKFWLFPEHGVLSTEALKNHFDSLDWQRTPRKLGPNHHEFFYLGKYSDSERNIKIVLRPSGRIQIRESLVGVVSNGGRSFSNLGNTVEMIVSENVKNKIQSVAREPDSIKTDTLDWD